MPRRVATESLARPTRHCLLLVGWIAYSLFLLILLTRPPSARDLAEDYFEGVDLVGHLGVFGIWGLVLAMLIRQAWGGAALGALGFLAASGGVFGLWTELLQNAVAGRSGSVADVSADVLGAVLGGVFFACIPARLRGVLVGGSTPNGRAPDPR
jgi:VanZ family protein